MLADVIEPFSINVSPFSRNVVLDVPVFSVNVVPKRRCYRALAFYVIEPLQLPIRGTMWWLR
ncbi:hypothetical protein HDG33_002268 [Paraburkholderia sp. Cpub6]|nr:hypothetical protein [Paraburkholderia sp. Cpub6]